MSSGQAYSALRATRTGPRWGLVTLCGLLFAAAVTLVVRDVRERRAWAEVVAGADGARRFPAALETANVIDDNGEAGIVLAEALAGGPLGDGSKPAAALILGVVEKRPGSALARLQLGRVAPLSGSPAGWERPLGLATAAAPGLDLAWSELGSRYLASWPSLSLDHRREAEETLRRAFASPDFLRAALPTAVETLGDERAVGALPDDVATLRRAAQILQEAGKERAAGLVAARLNGQGAGPGH